MRVDATPAGLLLAGLAAPGRAFRAAWHCWRAGRWADKATAAAVGRHGFVAAGAPGESPASASCAAADAALRAQDGAARSLRDLGDWAGAARAFADEARREARKARREAGE